jgi:hypothetical protein
MLHHIRLHHSPQTPYTLPQPLSILPPPLLLLLLPPLLLLALLDWRKLCCNPQTPQA